jgi:hypothetical protein
MSRELLINTILDHNEIYEIEYGYYQQNQSLSNGITTFETQTLDNNSFYQFKSILYTTDTNKQ